MFKPGSRKQRVYSHLSDHDPDATIAFGVTLGLAEGTVRSWVRAWSKGGDTTPTPNKAKARVPDSKKRVFDIGSPKRHGSIIVQGEQVSEVRWDDGHLQFITNDYLRPVRIRGNENAERGQQ